MGIILYFTGKVNHQLGTEFNVHRRIRLAVKSVECFSGGIPCIVLKGGWFNIVS